MLGEDPLNQQYGGYLCPCPLRQHFYQDTLLGKKTSFLLPQNRCNDIKSLCFAFLTVKQADTTSLKTDIRRIHSTIVWASEKRFLFKDFELYGRRHIHINLTFHGQFNSCHDYYSLKYSEGRYQFLTTYLICCYFSSLVQCSQNGLLHFELIYYSVLFCPCKVLTVPLSRFCPGRCLP